MTVLAWMKELQRRFEHEIKTNDAFFYYCCAMGAGNVILFAWLLTII